MEDSVKLAFAVMLVGSCCAFSQVASRPIKVGDVHVYAVEHKAERAVFDETVTVVSTDGGVIKTRHVRSDKVGAASDGMYTSEWAIGKSGMSGSEYDPPIRLVPRPLQVGTSLPFDSVGSVPNGARLRSKGDSVVAAQERISTPAGEFDTYRIEQKGYVNGISFQGGFGFTQKIWYAPSIDRMVRIEYKEARTLGAENIQVLKSFKPAD